MRGIERFFWGSGLALLGFYVLARGDGAIMSRHAVQVFAADDAAPPPEIDADAVDTHLWSPTRIRDYEQSLAGDAAAAIALLRIPKIHLEVPVFDDTNEIALNRGVGRIVGTAHPEEVGNLAIAGHRDGFFRGLKDIGVGDDIELVTHDATQLYSVSEVTIVEPDDVSVLDPTTEATMTLVTCYPFYFVGAAPQRYVVRARLRR